MNPCLFFHHTPAKFQILVRTLNLNQMLVLNEEFLEKPDLICRIPKALRFSQHVTCVHTHHTMINHPLRSVQHKVHNCDSSFLFVSRLVRWQPHHHHNATSSSHAVCFPESQPPPLVFPPPTTASPPSRDRSRRCLPRARADCSFHACCSRAPARCHTQVADAVLHAFDVDD